MRAHRNAAKTAFDWVVCLAVSPFAAVIGSVVALAIKLDSPGPVFFSQIRVGRSGRPFRILKFRTMSVGCDERAQRAFMRDYILGRAAPSDPRGGAALFKPDQDLHLTRVGRILRRTSLDELPQILNVLTGSMSLVGPRPHVPWEVEAYQPWHRGRLEALPGITGLAQVHGRSNIPFDRMAALDLDYIAKRSLALDLRILGHTLVAWLRGEGAA